MEKIITSLLFSSLTVCRYISELVKKLQIPVKYNQFGMNLKIKGSTAIGDSLMIWDGSTLTSAVEVATKDMSSIAETLVVVGEFLTRLEMNYIDREVVGKPFYDLTQYLNSGSNLYEYVNVTSKDFLQSHRVSDLLQRFGIEPIVRVIYGQELTVHAFASLVSLTSGVEPCEY